MPNAVWRCVDQRCRHPRVSERQEEVQAGIASTRDIAAPCLRDQRGYLIAIGIAARAHDKSQLRKLRLMQPLDARKLPSV